MWRKASESSLSTSVRCIFSVIKRGFHGGSTVFFLELEEDGVRIALTIVDTPGFGDNIDNEFACVCSLYARCTPLKRQY
jgi:hypothetical protein